MWGYDVSFAGKTAKENGLAVVQRPNIPAPQKRYEQITIPGRDGDLYISDGDVEDIKIPVEFNFIGQPEDWFEHFRQAKRWLTGRGKLQLGDDLDFFYKAKKVEIDTAERVCYEIGRFTATFTCDGYNYVERGTAFYDVKDVLHNPYYGCCPIYQITGEGACTLTVNGNTMKANVGQNLTIDTDLMIAYREDGTMMNTKVEGDYRKLRLQEGDNTIQVTAGFGLKVAPNWRCL